MYLASLSWKSSGTHLLATIYPGIGALMGKIAVIKYSTAADDPTEIKFGRTKYTCPFSAAFRPGMDVIYAMQERASGVQIWSETGQEWKQTESVYVYLSLKHF